MTKYVDYVMKYALIFIMFITVDAFSQCGCMSGAAAAGLNPLIGTIDAGLTKKRYLRTSSFITYNYGDKYYSGDSKTSNGNIQSFSNSFLNLNVGLGIDNDITCEAEVSYAVNKTQNFLNYSLDNYGMSYISLMLKHSLIRQKRNELSWVLGVGGKIPFSISENIPIHLNNSTGAFSIIAQSFLHKGFKEVGANIILINRAEYNFKNKIDYTYGHTFINSLIFTKTLFDGLLAVLDLKTEYRLKDKSKLGEVENSGAFIFYVSPQANYTLGNFGFTLMADIPVYKYYNGNQLTGSFNLGAALSWFAKVY